MLFDKVGWIIQFLSAWPLNPTNTKLILFLVYLIYENIYLLIAYNDFFFIFGDLQLMTTNLIGSLVQTIMMIRLIFVKFSKKVKNIIIEIQDDVCEKNYENLDDKKIYVQYSSLAITFYKVTMGFGTGAGLSFFILPLQNCILSCKYCMLFIYIYFFRFIDEAYPVASSKIIVYCMAKEFHHTCIGSSNFCSVFDRRKTTSLL